MNNSYSHIFSPFRINGLFFKNRIFSAPCMMSAMDMTGRPNQDFINYYASKARGGAAVVTIGDSPVDRLHGTGNPRAFSLDADNQVMLNEIATAIHEAGGLASQELNHAGRMAVKEFCNGAEGWMPWGPSDDVRERDGAAIHGMTKEEIDHTVRKYGEAAKVVKDAGFDMVLIHGGHGWIIDQFLSPLSNKRNDEYGGSLENRARFALEVIAEVRKAVGPSFPIEYRMSGAEETPGGLTKEEGIKFAQMIDGMVEIIHCSAAMDTRPELAVHTHPTIFLPHGVNVHYAEDIKKVVKKSLVATVGAISDPEMAEEILASGKADIVECTRALIADPNFVNKAKAGKAEDIIPCLRCLDCLTGLQMGNGLKCAVNPKTSRDARYEMLINRKTEPKKLLVVGGGPAGMLAAFTAAGRGHDVTLAEKTGKLGGLLNFTDYDELKLDLRRYRDYLICQTNKSSVKVLLNTDVDEAFIKGGGFDNVILAVGSSPAKPPIPGIEKAIHAIDIKDESKLGKTVAVLGGGLVGCETALNLARNGHSVTIIEMQDGIANDANWMHKEGMMQAFAKVDITIKTGAKVSAIKENAVAIEGQDDVKADSIVYALGMKANTDIVDKLYGICPNTDVIGDAVRARRVASCVEEAFWAAVRI